MVLYLCKIHQSYFIRLDQVDDIEIHENKY